MFKRRPERKLPSGRLAAGEQPVFYFQGLAVHADPGNALVDFIAGRVPIRYIKYAPWLDRPAKELLDLNLGFDAATAEIQELQPRGPIRLLGYSNGGYAAVHVARRLTNAGREIEFLALLDSSSYFPPRPEPNLLKRLSSRESGGALRTIYVHVIMSLNTRRRFELARKILMVSVAARGRQNVSDIIAKVMSVFWKEAVRRCPPAKYSGRAVLFCAEISRPRISDPFLGWAPFIDQIDKVVLRGNHWTMAEIPLAEDNARCVLAKLGVCETAEIDSLLSANQPMSSAAWTAYTNAATGPEAHMVRPAPVERSHGTSWSRAST